METLTFGAQISVTILVVIFVVAILIQGVIALLVRFDQWLLNRASSTTTESTPVSPNELSPEIIAVITAAIAETYDKKVRIKTIRYRRDAQSTSWVVQGRAAIMASHKVK